MYRSINTRAALKYCRIARPLPESTIDRVTRQWFAATGHVGVKIADTPHGDVTAMTATQRRVQSQVRLGCPIQQTLRDIQYLR